MGNHNSGRRPQAGALKLLRGNPGRRRLGREPIPPAGPVVKPAGLSGEASKVWETLAPIAEAMGTLTRGDVAAFASLCELQATFAAAIVAKVAAGGRPLEESQDAFGAPVLIVLRWVRLERETAAALRPYYEAFGLHPSARARMAAPAGAAPVSRWA